MPAWICLGEKIRGRHHDVVAGRARQQFGLQGFIAVIDVVAHMNARLFLEVRHRIFRDVVGPVVQVEQLFFGVRGCAELRLQQRCRHRAGPALIHDGVGHDGLPERFQTGRWARLHALMALSFWLRIRQNISAARCAAASAVTSLWS